MRRTLVLLFALLATAATPASEKQPLPQLDPALKEKLIAYLKAHPQSPEDYVVSKFKDHDVVFLGEQHRIKHDPELVAALIPKLYKAGIRTLATEFARREDQPLIDKLLGAPAYDEALARETVLRQFSFWGFKEYLDVYRAAWQLNRSLPPNAEPFRIVAVNDSPDWTVIRTHEDERNPELRKKMWRGGSEQLWAQVILDEVKKGNKVLVYSGMHHAFTQYRQPIVAEETHKFVRWGDVRMGNHVYNAIGKRAMTISLHSSWNSIDGYESSWTYPVDGVIDALLRELPENSRRTGFDTTAGTPFGDLGAKNAVYVHGYEQFTLSKFCDGYIIQKPFSEYAAVTPIPGFFTDANIEQARRAMPNPDSRKLSVREANQALVEYADVPRRYSTLQ